MKKNLLILLSIIFISSTLLFSQANFSTSLHKTRLGKVTAYKSENGGMQLITNIPMEQLACQKCHSTTEKYPDGTPIDPNTYQPDCKDCHNFAAGTSVPQQICLNCHSRQLYEMQAYPDSTATGDVHRKRGMTCTSCHTKAEIHGDDGVLYLSAKQNGAIKVKCENCHTNLSTNTSHTLHVQKVECSSCHSKSILTCAGCHFETVVAIGKNRAINQIKDYKILVKKNNKVHLGGFMTHTFQGKSNFIVSSYFGHIINKNATTCADCHFNMGGTNLPIQEYNTTGFITMNKWNPTTKKVSGPAGVVPLVKDWKTAFKMDYVTYTGDSTILPSDPTKWEYLKSTTDNAHLFYAEPLDSSTLAKLGVTRFPTNVNEPKQSLPEDFELKQNYPNPFNPTTKISFTLPRNEIINLEIFDSHGKLVRTLIKNQNYSKGNHQIVWNAKDDNDNPVTSGVYFTKLSAGSVIKTQKMVLLK